MKSVDIFPSKYLKSEHLNGGEPTVTISHFEYDDIKNKEGKQQKKCIIYFEGKELGLVCNRTNWDRIAYLYGDDNDDWVGKKITLYSELVQTPEGIKPGLRVKAPKGHHPKTQIMSKGQMTRDSENPAQDMNDEIPF